MLHLILAFSLAADMLAYMPAYMPAFNVAFIIITADTVNSMDSGNDAALVRIFLPTNTCIQFGFRHFCTHCCLNRMIVCTANPLDASNYFDASTTCKNLVCIKNYI